MSLCKYSKLSWCKENAPDAMKGCSEEELLDYMSMAWNGFIEPYVTREIIMQVSDCNIACSDAVTDGKVNYNPVYVYFQLCMQEFVVDEEWDIVERNEGGIPRLVLTHNGTDIIGVSVLFQGSCRVMPRCVVFNDSLASSLLTDAIRKVSTATNACDLAEALFRLYRLYLVFYPYVSYSVLDAKRTKWFQSEIVKEYAFVYTRYTCWKWDDYPSLQLQDEGPRGSTEFILDSLHRCMKVYERVTSKCAC